MGFVLDPGAASAAEEAVVDDLVEAAEAIARGTARRAKDHEYSDSVRSERMARSARTTTDNPFAHLDEWGSANNPPTGAMRGAAAEVGRFEPE